MGAHHSFDGRFVPRLLACTSQRPNARSSKLAPRLAPSLLPEEVLEPAVRKASRAPLARFLVGDRLRAKHRQRTRRRRPRLDRLVPAMWLAWHVMAGTSASSHRHLHAMLRAANSRACGWLRAPAMRQRIACLVEPRAHPAAPRLDPRPGRHVRDRVRLSCARGPILKRCSAPAAGQRSIPATLYLACCLVLLRATTH